jgi:hypothetical protein
MEEHTVPDQKQKRDDSEDGTPKLPAINHRAEEGTRQSDEKTDQTDGRQQKVDKRNSADNRFRRPQEIKELAGGTEQRYKQTVPQRRIPTPLGRRRDKRVRHRELL